MLLTSGRLLAVQQRTGRRKSSLLKIWVLNILPSVLITSQRSVRWIFLSSILCTFLIFSACAMCSIPSPI
jgi:hypothetical protein